MLARAVWAHKRMMTAAWKPLRSVISCSDRRQRCHTHAVARGHTAAAIRCNCLCRCLRCSDRAAHPTRLHRRAFRLALRRRSCRPLPAATPTRPHRRHPHRPSPFAGGRMEAAAETAAEAASVTQQHRASRPTTQVCVSGPARWRCSPCHSVLDRAACACNCRCAHLRVSHPCRPRLCRAAIEHQQCRRCPAAWSTGMAVHRRCLGCALPSHSALALCASFSTTTAGPAMIHARLDMASAASAARLHPARPDASDSSSSDTRSHPSPTRSDCRRTHRSAKSRKAKRNWSRRPRRWRLHFASTSLRPRPPQMALRRTWTRAQLLRQTAMARVQALERRPNAGIARSA